MGVVLLWVLSVTSPSVDTDWAVGELRAWLAGTRGPSHASAEEPPVRGALELTPGSAAYQEVVGLVRRPCRMTNAPAPEVPVGHLWEADLDRDGQPERVFVGGCSPDPYFVALKRGSSGWVTWHADSGFLINVEPRGDAVVFVAARDGEGIARESVLRLQWVAGGAVRRTLEFDVVGEQHPTTPAVDGERCELRAVAKLRYEPRVRDRAEESGMGFDYPGNLLQVVAKGSRGLAVGTANGFHLCAFARPPAVDDAALTVPAMRRPANLTVGADTEVLLVGWVPVAASRSNVVSTKGAGRVTWEFDVDDEEVRAYVATHLGPVHQCHEQALVTGTLAVHFAPGPKQLPELTADGPTTPLGECVLATLRRWNPLLATEDPMTLRLTFSRAATHSR
jgi:hypothetical protein